MSENATQAVVLVNLGTPDAPTTPAVRRYYREFLFDPRIVDIPAVPRWMLVNLIIAPFRAPKVAPLYQSVWLPGGSPLAVHSESLRAAVAARLPQHHVVLAMRYGNPSLATVLGELDSKRIRDIAVVPLFPHEASATTGSVREAVYQHYLGHPRVPFLRVLGPFFDDEGYLDAVANLVRGSVPADVEHVVFSYHGLPERQVAREDGTGRCLSTGCCDTFNAQNAHCYRAQCVETTRLLQRKLQLPQVSTAFQSRLGRTPWLKPSTDDMLGDLAKKGVLKAAVVTPGFVSDCLETLEELGQEAREKFHASGGELTVVPCLNGDTLLAESLARLVKGMPAARVPSRRVDAFAATGV
jgi:protoporphyrin/coproporphyrin ferrochelatase